MRVPGQVPHPGGSSLKLQPWFTNGNLTGFKALTGGVILIEGSFRGHGKMCRQMLLFPDTFLHWLWWEGRNLECAGLS